MKGYAGMKGAKMPKALKAKPLGNGKQVKMPFAMAVQHARKCTTRGC